MLQGGLWLDCHGNHLVAQNITAIFCYTTTPALLYGLGSVFTIFNNVSSNKFYYLKKLGCTSGSASPPLSSIMLPTQTLNSKDNSLYDQTFDLKIIKTFRTFFLFQ